MTKVRMGRAIGLAVMPVIASSCDLTPVRAQSGAFGRFFDWEVDAPRVRRGVGLLS